MGDLDAVIPSLYAKGTLVGRRYRDRQDQGRVGIVVENGDVLTSTPDKGVAISAIAAASATWEYAVLPAQWLARER